VGSAVIDRLSPISGAELVSTAIHSAGDHVLWRSSGSLFGTWPASRAAKPRTTSNSLRLSIQQPRGYAGSRRSVRWSAKPKCARSSRCSARDRRFFFVAGVRGWAAEDDQGLRRQRLGRVPWAQARIGRCSRSQTQPTAARPTTTIARKLRPKRKGGLQRCRDGRRVGEPMSQLAFQVGGEGLGGFGARMSPAAGQFPPGDSWREASVRDSRRSSTKQASRSPKAGVHRGARGAHAGMGVRRDRVGRTIVDLFVCERIGDRHHGCSLRDRRIRRDRATAEPGRGEHSRIARQNLVVIPIRARFRPIYGRATLAPPGLNVTVQGTDKRPRINAHPRRASPPCCDEPAASTRGGKTTSRCSRTPRCRTRSTNLTGNRRRPAPFHRHLRDSRR